MAIDLNIQLVLVGSFRGRVPPCSQQPNNTLMRCNGIDTFLPPSCSHSQLPVRIFDPSKNRWQHGSQPFVLPRDTTRFRLVRWHMDRATTVVVRYDDMLFRLFFPFDLPDDTRNPRAVCRTIPQHTLLRLRSRPGQHVYRRTVHTTEEVLL